MHPCEPERSRAPRSTSRRSFAARLLPLLAVVVAWACGATLGVGIQAGLWTAVAGLVALEVVAGLRAGLRRWALAAQASFGMLLGVALVFLRLVVH